MTSFRLVFLLTCLLGIPAGVGAFTFVYVKGFSYLSPPPPREMRGPGSPLSTTRCPPIVISDSAVPGQGVCLQRAVCPMRLDAFHEFDPNELGSRHEPAALVAPNI